MDTFGTITYIICRYEYGLPNQNAACRTSLFTLTLAMVTANTEAYTPA